MVDETTRREGMNQISKLTAQAKSLLDEAEGIADKTGNSFTFSLGERMMTYKAVPGPEFQSSNCYEDELGGWKSSSDDC